MDIYKIMDLAREMDGSDIHLSVGIPPVIRVSGSMKKLSDEVVTPEFTLGVINILLTDEQRQTLSDMGELDLAYEDKSKRRYRVNVFRQKGSYSVALRLIKMEIPAFEDLGLPDIIREFTLKKRGLIIVTGPTGSGKSTTLAAMIDRINTEEDCHILTLEDPIEYLHSHKKSVVNQREIGRDSKTYANAIKSALREDPDVILVGEMRDMETISLALTAAETGHLVMSTLHTIGAVKTIDRIIDVFPPHQQQQIRMQLSTVLQGVVSQLLIPKADGKGRVAAFEIMVGIPSVQNLIREGKTFQIGSVLQTGMSSGMVTMDSYLYDLYKKKLITYESALSFAADKDSFQRMGK